MFDNLISNSRIAKNTLFLYLRQILILFVSLYTVRVVLRVLGAEDYGIYNAVAGIVTMMNFLSASMASATQRFFSFAIGEGNIIKLKRVFNANIIIYTAIAVGSLVLLETVGYWFVAKELSVPHDRYDAAIMIYHFAVLSFIFSIFSSPFAAIIIAHEDMKLYAGISIIETLMKLIIVFILCVAFGDKLKIYGVLLCVVAFINLSIYLIVCFCRYDECRLDKKQISKEVLTEITQFTGWTLFGQVSTVARHQVITVMLNQMFNPMVVSARSIANSITNAANSFANNFNTSLYPPIVKEFALGDMTGMYNLVFNGCKMTFFLLWVVALPLILEMEQILTLWLVNLPEYTVQFTRLALIEIVINAVSTPIGTAARARGKMKIYELSLGLLQFLIPMVSFPLFKAGVSPAVVYYVAICINVIMFIVRLLIVRSLTGLPVLAFIRHVLVPIVVVVVLSFSASYSIQLLLPERVLMSVIIIICSVVVTSVIMYFIGFNKAQRMHIVHFVKLKLGSLG